ncbi:MAG: glycosyl transferase [Alphaproteobacteria bacterium]|nr:glycosyl transferase [Alphaproteobacteria bacterium]|tara:strand:- start:1113 stop:2075 length:963 start_codon:yes stop_codon:yes gene_type:complete
MTKLVIQIPCYNEAATLRTTLEALPKEVPGVDEIAVLIVDDGSEDETVAVAREAGVDHVVSLPRNRGLARAFMAGLESSVRLGADIIVNTDADNQYNADDIGKLVEPILAGKAEIVVGSRPISEIQHFSSTKKILQSLGSWVVRRASNTEVVDAPSGFRAMSRDAAQRLNVFSDYTYTLETIIQAGQKGMAITSVPIRVNGETRPSRLIRSVGNYLGRSIITILRIFITYRPLRFFAVLGSVIFLAGFCIGLRFLYFFVTEDGTGHIQSLILGSLLMSMGFMVVITGIVADLISVNRTLLEQIGWRLKKVEDELQKSDPK